MQAITAFLEYFAHVFDTVDCRWERDRTARGLATLLVIVFGLSLVAIGLNRAGLLPAPLSGIIPLNPFHAVNMAFTLLLLQEVMVLILVLPKSFSRSVVKQFEILALILLRSCFKELANIHEPLVFPDDMAALLRIGSDGAGAVVVFVLLAFLLRAGKSRSRGGNGVNLYYFVLTKKILALMLLCVFTGLGVYNLWLGMTGRAMFDFFTVFYTVLIFSDIFIVLVAQRYRPCFVEVFRNSGLALSTVFIRLALSAPAYYNAAMGVAAAAFALCIAMAYNYFDSGHLVARRE